VGGGGGGGIGVEVFCQVWYNTGHTIRCTGYGGGFMKAKAATKKAAGKSGKIIMGILTFLPAFYLILFATFFYGIAIWMIPGMGSKCEIPMFIAYLIPVHFLVVIIALVLVFYYIFNAAGSKLVDKDIKPLWIAGLLLGNVIIMPVYWYLYIWKDGKKTKGGGKNG
jgi:hypothetical protein